MNPKYKGDKYLYKTAEIDDIYFSSFFHLIP